MISPPLVCFTGKPNYECRAFSRLALSPDTPPVALDYLAAYGKPHPGSFIFASAMQSLERLENTFGKLRVESDAVVFYKNLTYPIPI